MQAIALELEDEENYTINYRVYVKDIGWTNWVTEGRIAGTTGQGRPIQAVEISIDPVLTQS